MLLKNGQLYFEGKLQPMSLRFEGDTITEIAPALAGQGEDCSDCLVIPGFVDIHSHGCKGLDFCTANDEEMDTMCRFYADNGVVGVAATGMTLAPQTLTDIFAKIGRKAAKGTDGAAIIGINMEGPFISEVKKGAHDAQYIIPPTAALLRELNQASGGRILLVDVSPTAEGALEFIRAVKDEVVVSLAHTPADYDTAMTAIEAGASNITHLYNAMQPFAHRAPGLIGAAFDSNVTAELICDGIHSHPCAIRTAFKMLGERAVLISDSMSAAGMPDGDYLLGGLAVTVEKRKAFLADGTIAGSTITVYDGFRNAVRFGVGLEQAIHAATTAPAKAARLSSRYGTLAVGRKADVLVLDKETLALRKVIIGGKQHV
ncbi:MAG: N-acetylglucosamine-6-phosphate deacetylase [Angelakisella sp.]